VIVDANGFQAMGPTKSVLDLEPLPKKFLDFGFAAAECGGHDVKNLASKLSALIRIRKGPQALIARTGK
jgi:transketolase